MALENKAPECAALVGVLLGLAWIFFSLRIYVKAVLTKGWGVDDLLLVIGIVLFTTYCTCAAFGVKYGVGRHLKLIPLEDIPKALHYWYLCELFYTLTTLFIRLSIALFLIRICVKRIMKVIIYATMAGVTVFSIFYFFLALFQCSPIDYFWNQYKGEHGSCMNPAVIPDASIAHSAVSFTADWILGLLPITLIWNLQMNQRTKISLAAILAVGLLAGIAAIIRIPYIRVLTITDDFLYATTDVSIWSAVEASLGIVAASAYTLRPLFRSLLNLSSRATAGYTTSKGAGVSRAGYIRNKASRAGENSYGAPNSQLGIPLRPEPVHVSPGVASHSPFGDSNENVRGPSQESEQGGIQVQRTFEIRTAKDEGADEMRWWTPEQPGSSVSIV